MYEITPDCICNGKHFSHSLEIPFSKALSKILPSERDQFTYALIGVCSNYERNSHNQLQGRYIAVHYEYSLSEE